MDTPQLIHSAQIDLMLQGGDKGESYWVVGQLMKLIKTLLIRQSNARHVGGKLIPHLNFSVPSAILAFIFEFSRGTNNFHHVDSILMVFRIFISSHDHWACLTDMQDFSLLKIFEQPNEHLASV
ncbi:hypothetical protein ACFE04_003897 [Oxalis oulophora]